MKETDFIKQNEAKWKEFEEILNNPKSNPEQMSRVFIETTDDLSFVRTRYKNRSVRLYLNGIAQRIHQNIYQNYGDQKEKSSFWKHRLPLIFWESRKELIISFVVFILSVGIGLLSSHYNPNFPEIILGEDYIEMTKANIESGNPMAVYDQSDPLNMFLAIAWNNIRVSFLVFVLGAFFSIGTLLALLRNGIMVGAFISFFIARDLFRESILAIMLHGTLELSSIVIAGAAGLTMGRGIIFPGTYSRTQAFLISARKGISMMIGITPFLIVAALIEGFATRHTDTPDLIRLLIILLSLGIVVAYFIYLPYRVSRSGNSSTPPEEIIQQKISKPVFEQLKTNGRIFTESFYFLQSNWKKVILIGITGALTLNIVIGYLSDWNYSEVIQTDYFYNRGNMFLQIANLFWFPDDVSSFFNFSRYPVLFPIFTIILGFLLNLVSNNIKENQGINTGKKISIKTLLIAAISLLPFLLTHKFLFILGLSIVPSLLIYAIFKSVYQDEASWSRIRVILTQGAIGLIGLAMMIASFQFVCMFLINTPISYFIFDFVLINLRSDWPIARQIPFLIYGLLSMSFIISLSYLTLISIGLYLGACIEKTEATQLKMSLQKFGMIKKYDGIERED